MQELLSGLAFPQPVRTVSVLLWVQTSARVWLTEWALPSEQA